MVAKAVSENKPVPRAVLEEYKGEKWADEALQAKPEAKGKVEGKATLQEAKAKAHLEGKIRVGNKEVTRKQNLDNLHAKGWKAERSEGKRPISQDELQELASLKKTAGFNENHPDTIRLRELQAKEKEGRPDVRYRAIAPDNTMQRLSKTEYEYMKSLDALTPKAEGKAEGKQLWEIVGRRSEAAVKWQRGNATITVETRPKTKAGTGGRRFVARVGSNEYRAITLESAKAWADEALQAKPEAKGKLKG